MREAIKGQLDMKAFLELDEIIGCPDCNDGGREWVEVGDGLIQKRVTFESPEPPEELTNLLTLLRPIRTTFQAQTGSYMTSENCEPF